MKKVIAMFIVSALLVSCDTTTTTSQDTEMLQKKYPKSIVYRVDYYRYIVADSTNVLDIRVESNGDIRSTVKIK